MWLAPPWCLDHVPAPMSPRERATGCDSGGQTPKTRTLRLAGVRAPCWCFCSSWHSLCVWARAPVWPAALQLLIALPVVRCALGLSCETRPESLLPPLSSLPVCGTPKKEHLPLSSSHRAAPALAHALLGQPVARLFSGYWSGWDPCLGVCLIHSPSAPEQSQGFGRSPLLRGPGHHASAHCLGPDPPSGPHWLPCLPRPTF